MIDLPSLSHSKRGRQSAPSLLGRSAEADTRTVAACTLTRSIEPQRLSSIQHPLNRLGLAEPHRSEFLHKPSLGIRRSNPPPDSQKLTG